VQRRQRARVGHCLDAARRSSARRAAALVPEGTDRRRRSRSDSAAAGVGGRHRGCRMRSFSAAILAMAAASARRSRAAPSVAARGNSSYSRPGISDPLRARTRSAIASRTQHSDASSRIDGELSQPQAIEHALEGVREAHERSKWRMSAPPDRVNGPEGVVQRVAVGPPLSSPWGALELRPGSSRNP